MKTLPSISAHPSPATVQIPTDFADLKGDLEIPDHAPGLVLFVHGSGSSRLSPRNQFVAKIIRSAGLGTLLFDLLTEKEEQQDASTGTLRFDIGLMAMRLLNVTRWVQNHPQTRGLKLGFFGASTGGAAALMAAAELGTQISAVVSRGGRPDLAGNSLLQVRSPTLFVVGGFDERVLCLNHDAFEKLHCEKEFRVVPRATHLFEEPGRLEQVAQISAHWFSSHMGVSDHWKIAA